MPTVGSMNKKTVSAVQLLDKRDIFPHIVDIQNEADFADLLKMMGRFESVAATNWSYHNYVNDAVNVLLTAGTVTNSGTPTVTLLVTPVNFVRVGDQITTIAGKNAIVTSVTRGASDTIIVKSVDNTNLTITAADKIPVVGRAEFENSSSPENLKFVPTKYENKIQIFRETDKITDVELGNEIEVMVNGQPYIVDYNAIKKVQSLKSRISGAYIAGQMSTDSFSDASPVIANADNYTAQTTRGLYDYIALYGVSDTAASPGAITFADISDLVNQLVANRAPNSYFQWESTAVGLIYDAYLKGTSNTGLTSARLNVDGKEINFMVEKYIAGGITFQRMRLPILDNSQLFNFSTGLFRKYAYFVPADKVKTEGGPAVGRIRIRYKKQTSPGNMGNEMIRETVGGMFSEQGDTQVANKTKEWYTAQGLECLGVQHFAKQQVIA